MRCEIEEVRELIVGVLPLQSASFLIEFEGSGVGGEELDRI